MTATDEVSSSVYVWQATEGKVHRVTTPRSTRSIRRGIRTASYLYFMSNRLFAPQISQDEFNYATIRQSGIFAMALRKGTKHPFPMESDEVAVDKSKARPVRTTGAARRSAKTAQPAPPAMNRW